MKKYIGTQAPFAYLFAILLLGINCNKMHNSHLRKLIPATITGVYSRLCVSKQGIALTFNGETEPFKGKFFVADNSLSDLNIAEETVFPIKVEVDTVHISDNCAYPIIHLRQLLKHP